MNTPVGKLTILDATTGLQILESNDIDFGATGDKEVWQCVKYILMTAIRSVVLDRDFGMDFTMVDKPMPIAQIMLTQEILMKINFFESRVEFYDITYTGDGVEGRLNPEVLIRLKPTTPPYRYV